ncbi:flavin reductase family protein [Mycolicibacterium hippocampi]|uniref:Putative oxidoreductase n=2 Tax=Mycolicibacterium hippocampi TaxID=659824 RepID=A0A7I9ZVA2_9MYCO|nr:putative oxidoreductase [Mycolicibacterium hippocampi]
MRRRPVRFGMGEHENPQGTAAFESLVSLLDYPMFIVTTRAGDQQAGCLVGFSSQTSINPPRFLVGLSRRNHTFTVAAEATHLAVHVLPRDELPVARLFGGETGDETDKFARCTWHPGPEGLPILDAAESWFAGKITHRFDVGDHVGHLLEPMAGSAPDDLRELISFSDVRDVDPGHDA